MAWVILVAAALLEIVWATALKNAEGFTRLGPSLAGIGGAALSFVLLGVALKTLAVGTAYAVWVGLGAFGVALAGAALYGEALSPPRIACLALIVAGVAGLKITEG